MSVLYKTVIEATHDIGKWSATLREAQNDIDAGRKNSAIHKLNQLRRDIAKFQQGCANYVTRKD